MKAARPQWVPSWIWAEYSDVDFFTRPDSEFDTKILRQILRDKDCAVVWITIDRRKGKPTERRNLLFRARGWGEDLILLNEAEQLFDAILSAAVFVGEKTIASAERRKIARNIRRHANALLAQLIILQNHCVGGGRSFPAAFDVQQQLAAQILCDRVIAENIKYGNKEWESEKFVEAFKFGAACAMWSPNEMLAGLVVASDQWQSTRPPVAQTNSADAKRLYFLRKMTSYFCHAYGTPLRECVAALTRCIYQCDMDSATVAKLAPLSKLGKPDDFYSTE